MATTPTRLMTFAEFEQLPDPPVGHYELHGGELTEVPPPSFPHIRVQKRLCDLLRPLAGAAGVVDKEIPFRTLPEHEYQTADVVFLSTQRWDLAGKYLFGAPELVIEVLSPSNRRPKLARRQKLCLEHGCREYWVVNTDRHEVKVTSPDGGTTTYGSGEQVPVFLGGSIAVDAIFS